MTIGRGLPADGAEDVDLRRRFPPVTELLLPYWKTREGMVSLAMLIYMIACGWLGTYFALWINKWTGTFYDAIGGQKFQTLPHLLISFLVIAIVHSTLSMTMLLADSVLEIRWRTWLTKWLMNRWLARNSYYAIERDKVLENIDQRIAEDAKLFVRDSLTLFTGVLHVPVSFVTFSLVLWQIGGVLNIPLGGHVYQLPGYLILGAILYQGVIFIATHYLGRRLITLNAQQQRLEGDFRVSMVKVREFAEQIAFFKGSGAEGGRLARVFHLIVGNFYSMLWVRMRVAVFTNVVGQVSSVLPTILALPQLMSGGLSLGGLMRSNAAFQSVTGTLSFFSQVYPQFTSWRAEANRLCEFLYVQETEPKSNITVQGGAAGAVEAERLMLYDGQGGTIARVPDFALQPGQRCLVRGRSGCGKSTLLRALAGLWPYGAGTVTRSDTGVVFLPQRSYIPTGTLKAAMTYPHDETVYNDRECIEILEACGLTAYADALHVADRWGNRFSGGEQQRVAFARALLAKPSTLFLDECTSALDSQSERDLYRLLITRLPRTTLVSVAHRKELVAFHDAVLDFSDGLSAVLSNTEQMTGRLGTA